MKKDSEKLAAGLSPAPASLFTCFRVMNRGNISIFFFVGFLLYNKKTQTKNSTEFMSTSCRVLPFFIQALQKGKGARRQEIQKMFWLFRNG